MINHFNFERKGDKFLITNDFGRYDFLETTTFRELVQTQDVTDPYKRKELKEKGFLIDRSVAELSEELPDQIRQMKNYVFSPTSLFLFTVTNSCNLNCIYCQAKDKGSSLGGYMTPEVGRRAVDIALQSPSHSLTFEFQGGEPLLNFNTIKAVVEYTEQKKGLREIEYTLVSNLAFLTDDKINFFRKYNVQISTSLDGPAIIHNRNRVYPKDMNSYGWAIRGINKLRAAGLLSGAIETTTRNSLPYAQEIVDEYVNQGFQSVFLRPLTPLGFAQADWERVGYPTEEFLSFYKNALKYILTINKQGIYLREQTAAYFLRQIMANDPYNYMELRSPCGAGIGQMSVYYDGEIYTCDEGRMVSESGDFAFHLGNVWENSYRDLVSNSVCRTTCIASVTECIPGCCDCVYQPYCGVCPVVTHSLEYSIFPREPHGYRCRVNKGIMDILFQYLYEKDSDVMNIFRSWIGEEQDERE